jgi:hypothetical protein
MGQPTPVSAKASVGVQRQQAPSITPSPTSQQTSTEEELAEAGLISMSNILRTTANATGLFRNLYNQGESEIAAEITRLRAAGQAESVIAQRASSMRRALALRVREASGTLMRKAAEAFDAIRGNVARPTYESLRAAGKSDAQIIRSALKTNSFVNRFPAGVRWTGRGLWVVSAGISLFIVLSAPEEQRVEVAQQEIGGLARGAAGSGAAGAICLAAGIATEGLGLLVCGLLGGLIGFEAGRTLPSILQESGRMQVECLQACESLTGWRKVACQMGCSPPSM